VWLVLALTTIVAAGLRFPFLNNQSLWLDEVFTREIVGEATLSGVWRHLQQTESTPPLYYLIGWLVGARSAAAMRMIPALALTAAVPVGYLAFRRLVGQRAALATAAVLAVSPMLVSYAADARSYGLLVFTGLLTVWGFSAVIERPSGRRYALWALACIACVWTHYFGGFLVVSEAAILLVLGGRERLPTLGWLIVIAVCVGPLVPLVAHQASSERAAFIESESLPSRVLMTVRQFAMGANVPRTWLEGAGVVVWCLAVGFGTLIAIRRSRGARLALMLASVSVGLPLLIGVAGIEDRFYARNVTDVVPIMAALAAPAMLRLRGAPLACYLALALLSSIWVATNWRYEQPDWRDAIARIETADPHAPLIAVTRSAAPVVRTYLGRGESPAAGLMTESAWVVVEPTRGAHDRALVPAPAPAIPGFSTVRELRTQHAFRLILIAAGRPTHIASGVIPHSAVFPGRS
jgi:4-amino-4-deoxy-L-arabinose transferase-like glycosyltransferase